MFLSYTTIRSQVVAQTHVYVLRISLIKSICAGLKEERRTSHNMSGVCIGDGQGISRSDFFLTSFLSRPGTLISATFASANRVIYLFKADFVDSTAALDKVL